MPQRVIKIILPGEHGKEALELLESQDKLIFWQEELSGSNFVASALTDLGNSETLMDLFEKQFSSVEGFKLILFPVEASIPRMDVSGVITFLFQGVSPRAWWEADKAKKATRKALMLWSIILIVLAATILLWQTKL